MRIIVCIKQVPDPEGDWESFEIMEDGLTVTPRGIPPVLGVFDENALEAALRIRDAAAVPVGIPVLSIGKKVTDAVIIKALAAGADEVIKVEDPLLMTAGLSSMAAAKVLASIIQKIGTCDLILTGRQSSDLNAGETGIYLGLHLNIPVISMAKKVDAEGGKVRAQRLIPGGHEVVVADLPALVVVSNEVGELRYPAMKVRREARKKPILRMTIKEIGVNGVELQDEPPLVLTHLKHPVLPGKKCHYFSPDDPAAAGKDLVRRLADHHFV